jgi:hypothetical protein
MKICMCYTCHIRPAGNDYGGSYSAYCAECQPVSQDPKLKGIQCLCRGCGEVFATLTDFESHRREFSCLEPRETGMELDNGVWGTPEGNMRRAEKRATVSAAIEAINQRRSAPKLRRATAP